ncbi:MAG TPA: DUF3293 domain-containing protein [Candidatus Nanopelagicales bacterium]|nr:DUF3293 domain-containing protein [Candidatus Nanopelagicales bacterium]
MRPDLHDAPRPIDVALLSAYLATEVVDAHGRAWSGASAIGLDRDVWVVTAENPFSEKQDDAANAAAMSDLAAEIRRAGHEPTALVGRAPDLSWSEECFGVDDVDPADVRRWGRDRGQHAVFWLTVDEHRVVSCWSGEVLASRPRAR